MNAPIETLESELVRDLQELSDRLGDEQFCVELYRALTNTTLSKEGGPDGHLVLSWNRAAEFVNETRAREGHPPLSLAQSGGEGVVSDTVLEELEPRGWQTRPLNTSRHDERHAGQPNDSEPPKGAGEQHSPAGDSGEWAREAHAQADRAQRDRLP